MTWVSLTLASAVVLGLYDLSKKSAVRDNAVPAVLFVTVAMAAAVWAPLVVAARCGLGVSEESILYVASLSGTQHLMLLGKSMLVGASWAFAYMALKHLPISIASPIRATAPFWTILIAITLFAERPTPVQWLGIGVILAAFYRLTWIGRREGIHFHRDKWVGCMVIATILAAWSGIYDKFLLQRMSFSPATVQAWFSIDLVLVTLPWYLKWRRWDRATDPFQWRWTLPAIAATLLVADFFYFAAVQQEGALISVISPLRRTSVVVSFLLGMRLFREQHFRPKAICVSAIVMGVWLLTMSN